MLLIHLKSSEGCVDPDQSVKLETYKLTLSDVDKIMLCYVLQELEACISQTCRVEFI